MFVVHGHTFACAADVILVTLLSFVLSSCVPAPVNICQIDYYRNSSELIVKQSFPLCKL